MKRQQWTVGILLFDQVDLTDITGPSEVFHHAGYSRRDLHQILFGRDITAFYLRNVTCTSY